MARKPPGAYLYLLGLWPIREEKTLTLQKTLNNSRIFVDRLLGPATASLPPTARIEAIRLDSGSEQEIGNLVRFLHTVDTKPFRIALEELSKNEALWIGNLRVMPPAHSIQSIDLTSWRNRNGTIARWSGLIEDGIRTNRLHLSYNQTQRSAAVFYSGS